jgi:hypothetical protein
MGLFRNFVNQTRKPEGFLGKMMVNGMNDGHAKMADWGLSHLTKANPSKMIELGCGGGRNARDCWLDILPQISQLLTIHLYPLKKQRRITRRIEKNHVLW